MSKRARFLVGWMIALALAAALDSRVATRVRAHNIDEFVRTLNPLRELIKRLGYYPTTIAIALLVGLIHPWRWQAGAFVLVSTLPAALNEPIKWLAGRVRPFKTISNADISEALPFRLHPMPTPITKLFTTPNLSFPSGHAALAFATAAAMSILFPRWRIAFFIVAGVVGLERFLENAHWCSDVIAGALLGIVGVKCVHTLALIYNRRRALPHAI